MNRCTGHCCRRFPLPASFDEIVRRRNASVCPAGELWIEDGDMLADMLLPLGTEIDGDGTTRFYFTCRHLDQGSGDCKIYELRPRMCRDYPYGKACIVEGCTAPNRGVVDELVQVRVS